MRNGDMSGVQSRSDDIRMHTDNITRKTFHSDTDLDTSAKVVDLNNNRTINLDEASTYAAQTTVATQQIQRVL